MFRFEISFTLPGLTRLRTEIRTGNAPWEAANQVRAEHGADITVIQTRCL